MRSTKDIKILLFVGFAIGYPLAVLPAILIDPLLKSHVLYPARNYPYGFVCVPIYLTMLTMQFLIMTKGRSVRFLYVSVLIFLISIVMSLPLFMPEFPHGNIFQVGLVTTFLCCFSIFVWSIGRQIALYTESLTPSVRATVDFITALLSFVRQGAFAAVTLFGVLFYGAFTTVFSYVDAVVTDKSDVFLLKYNTAFQIGFYAIYSIVGPVRYFFMMNLHILSEFKKIVTKKSIDSTAPRKPSKMKRA
jgi:hypothetical protein